MTDGQDRKPAADLAPLPHHELNRLLAVAIGRSLTEAKGSLVLTPAQQERFDALVSRRLGGEPLQYLEGTVPFAGVELKVDERVLIPRPETEYLVELVTAMGGRPWVVVDLCTGSGAVALALKRLWPETRVIGTDISSSALELAIENGRRNHLEVEWLVGDLFDPLPRDLLGNVGVLVANPPYVPERDWEALPADVRREPRHALIAGPRGTEIIEAILDDVGQWLDLGGVAWIEVGDGQAGTLAKTYSVETVNDQYGMPRYLRFTNSPSREP